MSNCQERECVNVQSAICLHCQLYLCVTHIVDHGRTLLKEGDELCEDINELAEQLNVYLQQVHLAHDEATEKLDIWRKNQIKKVEEKYAKNFQDIQFQKDHLTDLENQLTKRLTDEVIQPFEYMQTRHSASSESLKTIRKAIINITQESSQLDLCLNQTSSNSLPQQNVEDKTQYFVNSSINPSDLQLLLNAKAPPDSLATNTTPTDQVTTTTTQTRTSSSSAPIIPKPTPIAAASTIPKPTTTVSAPVTTKPTPTGVASTIPKPATTVSAPVTAKPTTTTSASVTTKPTTTASASVTIKPTTTTSASVTTKPTTVAAASAQPVSSWRQSTTSLNLKTTIKRPATNSCRMLVAFFEDVSGSSNRNIENFIIKNLNKVLHVNNLMVLLLSLLEAWHSPKALTIINDNVLTHHINIVKKYIKGSDHQLTVIAACQVFLTSFQYDDQKTSEMINALLRFFLTHQCITEEIVFIWYKNGGRYGYSGFEKARLCAKSFIDYLNTNQP